MEVPLSSSAYLMNYLITDKKARRFVALLLCLFLFVGLIVSPHVVFKKVDTGNWTIEITTDISQAPRNNFLGAWVCLPPKHSFDTILLSSFKIGNTIEAKSTTIKNEWLIMYWYGSSYI